MNQTNEELAREAVDKISNQVPNFSRLIYIDRAQEVIRAALTQATAASDARVKALELSLIMTQQDAVTERDTLRAERAKDKETIERMREAISKTSKEGHRLYCAAGDSLECVCDHDESVKILAAPSDTTPEAVEERK